MDHNASRANRRLGHSYDNSFVSDNGRAHFGDVYTGTVNYYLTPSVQHEPLYATIAAPLLLDQAKRTNHKRKRTVDEHGVESHDSQQDSLRIVLSKLQKLAALVETPLRDTPASKVAGRIGAILDALRTSGFGCPLHKHSGDEWNTLQERLTKSTQVTINSSPPVLCHEHSVRVGRKYDVFRYGGWEISLTTTAVRSPSNSGHAKDQRLSVLRLEPRCVHVGSPLVGFFGVRTDFWQTSVLHPVIFAYRTIPPDSEVFRTIERDDAEGLIKLLATQKVTIRDCDDAGRSLLQYACSFLSPLCCKYLCESGSDLDRLAFAVSSRDLPVPPLLAAGINDSEMTEDEYTRTLQCRRSLLEAGADPTIESADGSTFMPIPQALFESNVDWIEPDTLELMFKYSKHFIDLRGLRISGHSIWLLACSRCMYLRTVKVLEILLKEGCDSKETDSDGWNCLFYCVLGPHEPRTSKELEALLFLLSVFPNIYAKDNEGFTIFDYVDDIEDDEHGSYARDLWYCGLDRAGLIAPATSERQENDAKYTLHYTPRHHRALRYLDVWTVDIDGNFDTTQLDAIHPWTDHETAEMIHIEILREKRSSGSWRPKSDASEIERENETETDGSIVCEEEAKEGEYDIREGGLR